jgi:hypothetical protein
VRLIYGWVLLYDLLLILKVKFKTVDCIIRLLMPVLKSILSAKCQKSQKRLNDTFTLVHYRLLDCSKYSIGKVLTEGKHN